MGRPRKVRPNWNELATIWSVSDELWQVIHPILAEVDPPKATGRPRVDARRTLDAVIFRMRTGCQWNQLPERFPDDSSVHRTFQRWDSLGLFDKLWATLLTYCRDLDGVDWEWQAADGNLCKARGVPKRGRKTKVSAKTPQIVVSRASRKACLSPPCRMYSQT